MSSRRDPSSPEAGGAPPGADDGAAGSSGSIDVAFSAPEPRSGEDQDGRARAKPEPRSGEDQDGQARAKPEPRSGEDQDGKARAKPEPRTSDGTPAAVAAEDSAPIPSGKLTGVMTGAIATATAAGEPTPAKRIADAAVHVVEEGVHALGAGIGTLGEGVTKLGERSRNVPLVGASVARLGEGITSVGETLTELPRVARTRRGRLLVRSLVVGFLLVFAWISVIVVFQVRDADAPDFRPNATRILTELSRGQPGIDELYEQASPRFQEMVRKERFVDDMTDMLITLGKFREITSINETLVTRGPTGRIGRISLNAAFDRGTTRCAVSLHWDQDRWKLFGCGCELPPDLKISQAQREERVQACRDPMDAKRCEVHRVSNVLLEQLRDNRADLVWDNASRVFQTQEERARFIQIQAEHAAVLGDYRRIIAVTEAKVIRGTSATFDVLVEYAHSQGVRVVFGFVRSSKSEPWQLRSFKRVLPMPRLDDAARLVPPPPLPTPPAPPPRAGSGSSQPARPPARPPTRPATGQPRPAPGSAAAPTAGSAAPPAPGSAAAPAPGSTAAPATGSTAAPATGSASAPAPGSASAPAPGSASAPAPGSAAPSSTPPSPGDGSSKTP